MCGAETLHEDFSVSSSEIRNWKGISLRQAVLAIQRAAGGVLELSLQMEAGLSMVEYIFKRCLTGALTLFVLITVTFFLTHLMPGNPFEGENITNETLEELSTAHGLDKPVFQQYVDYLAGVLHGDLGDSYKKPGVSVVSLIAKGASATVALGLIAYAAALLFGTFIGVWEAVTKRGSVRGALMLLSTLGIGMPNFILAILLMFVFGIWLRWFPLIGLSSPSHFVLPVLTLAVYPIAQISRLVHSNFTEALRMDYVIMARAKGLPRGVILFRHVLKNTLIPVITNAGPTVAFLMVGSFVVESIFTIPGIGQEFVNAVSNRDYPLIMGLTIFVGATIIVCNLIADIVCSIVDPRVRMGK